MDLSQSVGPCPVCRSCIYESTDMGFLVCEYGHQSQTVWQEEQDDFDANLTGASRRLKKPKVTSVPAGSTLTTVSAGDGGFSLKVGQPEEEGYYPSGSMVIRLGEVDRYNVILALQYILRAQIKSLLQAINLDDDNGLTRRRIELSVRKVWILFIGTLGVEYDEDEILQDSPVTSPSSSGIYAADSAGSSRGSSPAPPSTTVVSMELLDEILNSQPLTSITQEAPPRIPRPKRSFPHTGSVNRKPIERVGLISLLAIIYLGLLEAGVPILVADLRRLLIHKILPYGDAAVRAAIPTPLRRELEAKKWGVIFKPKAVTFPTAANITSIARRISYQLADKAGHYCRAIPVRGLIRRLHDELRLPHLFMPMVEAVIAKRNLLMSFDRESDGHRSFSPELNMVAAIIFILNLHYAFDHPRRVGYLDSILCKWMVPSSRDLLAQWRALPDRSDLKFRHLPAQGELPWDQLDSYLTFCEQLGMTLPSSGEGEDDEQQQGPKQWQHHHFDQIAIPRPSPDYPVGPTDPEVLTGLLHDLRRSKKIWTLIEVDTIERLPSAYRALLEAVSGLLDWNDPLELLRRTNRVFYQK